MSSNLFIIFPSFLIELPWAFIKLLIEVLTLIFISGSCAS